jgi:uncharacterized protein (DUF697 family)
MRLPIDPRDVMKTGEKIAEERERPLRIAIFVDVEAPDSLVDAVQEALRPQTSRARLHVEACAPGEMLIIDDAADAVIAIAGPGDTLRRSLAGSREKFVPTVALALGEHADSVSRRLGHPILDTIAEQELDEITPRLGTWLADRVSGKRLALAANFALVRRAVAVEAVRATSFQNGVIGAVAIIPGADLPIMTANQAKMVLQVAAAYGVPLGAERIKELAAVVGGAFTLRAVARQFLDFVPGVGWAIKGAIGYTGTIAMGYAAIEYFEAGADLSGLGEKLKEARDKAVDTAVRTRDKLTGQADDEPIPARAYVVASTQSAPTGEAVVQSDPDAEPGV